MRRVARCIFNGLTLLSAALAVATALAWPVSYHRSPQCWYVTPAGFRSLTLGPGCVKVYWSKTSASWYRPVGFGAAADGRPHNPPVPNGTHFPAAIWRWTGLVSWEADVVARSGTRFTIRHMVFPLWLTLSIFAILPVLAFHRFRRDWRRRNTRGFPVEPSGALCVATVTLVLGMSLMALAEPATTAPASRAATLPAAFDRRAVCKVEALFAAKGKAGEASAVAVYADIGRVGLLTVRHAVEGADLVTVTLPDGRERVAKVMLQDDAPKLHHVALLVIEADWPTSIATGIAPAVGVPCGRWAGTPAGRSRGG